MVTQARRQADALAELFRILGEPTRLRILMELEEGERNVSELCKILRTPQPTVSHHLGILRMGGLVVNRRDGKEIYYSVANLARDRSGRALAGLLRRSACLRLGSFVLGVERE